jgi:anti-sigma regulatory factor (Ser/Thr protein kinase)
MTTLGRRRFEGGTAAPRQARRWVTGLLSTSDDPGIDLRSPDLDDVLVMVSELATNAISHGGGGFEVSLLRSGDQVRIEVVDSSPAVPQAQWVPAGATSGRGLAIVDALSDAWGVTALEGGGKAVWFEARTSRR